MSLHVGVSGAFKAVAAPSVGVGGAWKAVAGGWVGVGGAWKKFFDPVAAHLDDQNVLGDAQARFDLKSNGNFAINTVDSGTWLISGTGADFEVKAELASGDPVSSGTIGSWQSLSSNRTWSRASTGGTFHLSELSITIRRASDGVELTTATVTLEADNT